MRHYEPEHITRAQPEVVDQVKQHRPARNLDQRLGEDVAGVSEGLTRATHWDDDVERGLITDRDRWRRVRLGGARRRGGHRNATGRARDLPFIPEGNVRLTRGRVFNLSCFVGATIPKV